MKLPGRLWLQFEVDPDGHGGAQIRQTTVFDPAGYVGLSYWYLLAPVHHHVFGRVLDGIGRALQDSVGCQPPAGRRIVRKSLARFASRM